MKRYVVVAKEQSETKDKIWAIDNSTKHRCDDLKDVKVSASFGLTDYVRNGNHFSFDSIEFFDTKFNVIRVSMSSDQKTVSNIETIKSDSIGSIFNCDGKGTTVLPPDTTPGEGPSDGGPDGSGEGEGPPKDTDEETAPKEEPTESSSSGFPFIFVILLLILLMFVIAIIVWFVISKGGGGGDRKSVV